MAIGAGAPTTKAWDDLRFCLVFGEGFDNNPERSIDGEPRDYSVELMEETPESIRARCAGYLDEQA